MQECQVYKKSWQNDESRRRGLRRTPLDMRGAELADGSYVKVHHVSAAGINEASYEVSDGF
jgi:hypothetical protein